MNKGRKLVMRQFGDTIGPARYQLFINDMKKDNSSMFMLPRPVIIYRPGEIGNLYLLNTQWVRDVVSDVAMFTDNYLNDE